MKYYLTQDQFDLMSEPELYSKFDQVFNELAARKQAVEEYHCVLVMIQGAIQKHRLRLF